MTAFSAIRAQISHFTSAMRNQEKNKLPSQPEANTSGKIEVINCISSTLNDNMLEMIVVISLRSGKVLDELI